MKTLTLTPKEYDALFHILLAAKNQWPNYRKKEFQSLLAKLHHEKWCKNNVIHP
jgi:hypothetical protein